VFALLDKQLSEPVSGQFFLFELKHYGTAHDGFFLVLANLREEGVFQAVLQRDPEVGVEYEYALEEVDRFGRGTWVFQLEVGSALGWKLGQVLEGLEVGYE